MEKIMDDGIGKVIIPLPSKDETHLFGLYDENENKIDEGDFSSAEIALKKARKHYGCPNMYVKDLDEEYYLELSRMYRKRIKLLNRSFKISMLILDITKWFRSRTCDCYYTYLSFSYKGVEWIYREDAKGEWINKV